MPSTIVSAEQLREGRFVDASRTAGELLVDDAVSGDENAAGDDVARTAGELLVDVDRLARQIVGQVWGVVPGYEPPRMLREDLEAAVTPNVKAVLEHVISPEADDPAGRERARQLGAARALQGVPLDVVVQSFRTAERVVLDAFLTHRTKMRSVDEMRAGLRLLAEGFDQLSSAAIDAYRETQNEITAHYDRIAGDLIAGLVSGDLDPGRIDVMVRTLGSDAALPCQALALAVVAEDEAAGLARTRRRLLAELASLRRGRIVAGQAGDADVYLIPGSLGRDDVRHLDAVLADAEVDLCVAAGAPSPRLADAGRSCRQAVATLQVARAWGRSRSLTLYDDVLIDTLVASSDDASDRLVELFRAPLDARDHLVATITSYLDHDMSIQDTARALYLHPNTVAYRLSRIRELTGFDPRRPRELMLFWLASRAPRSARET